MSRNQPTRKSVDVGTHNDESYSVKMLLTPEIAQSLLENNMSNRAVSYKTVEKYIADIKAGNWGVNGEAIKVGKSNELWDGQHRCMAVVETGIPITTWVIFNLPPEAQETMDSGRPRTFTDQLKRRGEANYTALGTVIRTAVGYEAGSRLFRSNVTRSITELMNWLDDNPEIRESVVIAQSVSNTKVGIRAGVAGGLHWVFAKIDKEDADEFFRLVRTAAHEEGSPILALRETLRKQRDRSKGELNPRWVAAITVKAWNKWRNGETVANSIQFRPGGAKPENFPEPC